MRPMFFQTCRRALKLWTVILEVFSNETSKFGSSSTTAHSGATGQSWPLLEQWVTALNTKIIITRYVVKLASRVKHHSKALSKSNNMDFLNCWWNHYARWNGAKCSQLSVLADGWNSRDPRWNQQYQISIDVFYWESWEKFQKIRLIM